MPAMTRIGASHQTIIPLVWRPKLQWKNQTTHCCLLATLLDLTVGRRLWSQVIAAHVLQGFRVKEGLGCVLFLAVLPRKTHNLALP